MRLLELAISEAIRRPCPAHRLASCRTEVPDWWMNETHVPSEAANRITSHTAVPLSHECRKRPRSDIEFLEPLRSERVPFGIRTSAQANTL
jgi:hypothetical protein